MIEVLQLVSEKNEELRRNNVKFLLDHDQLYREIEDGHVFRHFTEPPITFNPTYKFDQGKFS